MTRTGRVCGYRRCRSVCAVHQGCHISSFRSQPTADYPATFNGEQLPSDAQNHRPKISLVAVFGRFLPKELAVFQYHGQSTAFGFDRQSRGFSVSFPSREPEVAWCDDGSARRSVIASALSSLGCTSLGCCNASNSPAPPKLAAVRCRDIDAKMIGTIWYSSAS